MILIKVTMHSESAGLDPYTDAQNNVNGTFIVHCRSEHGGAKYVHYVIISSLELLC